MNTSSAEYLNERFSIPGIRFDQGNGGLTRLQLRNDSVTGELYLLGAHVTSFCPRGAKPVLWMSRESYFEKGKPIRGGVPICFPWFGPNSRDAKLPGHGWARLREWDVVHVGMTSDSGFVVRLNNQIDDFDLTYQVCFGSKLILEITIRNSSPSESLPSFEEALHSYFAVHDVRNIEIRGLEECSFVDKVGGLHSRNASYESIRFTAETDRVYQSTSSTCCLIDSGSSRKIIVRKWGSMSTVVWNPWIEKSNRMPDFGDDEWPDMVCIETANVGEHAILLGPGQTHTMIAEISVEADR